MPDELVFEQEDGSPVNDLRLRRNNRGVASVAAKIYLRNTSTLNRVQSTLFVVPGEGSSYSEDLYITSEATRDAGWGKSMPVSIGPGERQLTRIRVNPRVTPPGTTTTAGLRLGAKSWTPIAAQT